MQMIELVDRDISVYLCHFHLHLHSANISIKFPCHYFAEWKSLNGKVLSSSHKYASSSSASVQFGQVLELKTQMLFDNKEKLFYKKETLMAINLVSKSRPDQVKLVGRVNIDLAQIANNTISIYSEYAPNKLTYCSVNADVTFKVQIISKDLTDKNPNNLDKSSFNDFFIINTGNNTFSPEFGSKPSPIFSLTSTSNIKNSKNFISKIRQSREVEKIQASKRVEKPQHIFQRQGKTMENEQTQIIIKNNSSSQINKKDDTSFRTVAQRRQPSFKNSGNDLSMDHQHNLFTLRDNKNFSQEIDLNKKKIADLQRKIGDLCKNLEDSKGTTERTNKDAKQKEELVQKLSQNEERMRVQFQELKRMKMSSSSQQNMNLESDDLQQLQSPKQSHFSHLYQQKISQTLQTQRILQENQYIIRELEATRSQLEKKLSFQRNQTEQLQMIWKEKKEYYEEKIGSLEKEKREGQYEIEQLTKYKYRVEEAIEERNRMKLEYKELQHQLMKARFELNDKIQKNAQTLQKLQTKETELQNSKQQIRELSAQKMSFQKQITELLISNQKLHALNSVKDQEISKFEDKLQENQKNVNELRNELQQAKRSQEEKGNMEEKLLQYNSHMSTLQGTIKNLQNELQACQYISKINQNLKQEISRLEQRISQANTQSQKKQYIISQNQHLISQLSIQLQKLTEQKNLLLQKNLSFSEQLQHIESMLQESFHKASKESQLEIGKLKQELRISNEQYERLLKDKGHLEQEIESMIEEKQETISQLQKNIVGLQLRIQSLSQCLNDKQNIITLKDIQLQNRKSIAQQLALKLQKMQDKENSMQQTIAILQTESRKIFDIIDEKEKTDQEIMHLRASTQEHLEIIKELEDVIVEMRIQKEEILRKYYEEIDRRESNNSSRSNHHEDSLIRKKLQEAQNEVQELGAKIYHLNEEINTKQRYIDSLENKNDSLLKKVIYLEAIVESQPQVQGYQQSERDNNALAIRERQMQLRLQQQKNLQKFVNQISQLSHKIIELQAIVNQKNQSKSIIYDVQQTKNFNNMKEEILDHQDQNSREITPIRHKLNDELVHQESPQNNNYVLSERKKPTSNSSQDSHNSLQLVNSQKVSEIQNLNSKQTHLSRSNLNQRSGDSKKESPQLKISQLSSLIQVKNLIIKDLENKCIDLKTVIREKEKQIYDLKTVQKNQQTEFTGRIKTNSPRKHSSNKNNSQPYLQQHQSSNNKNRRRSPSPSSKIANNQSFSQKEFIRMKNTTQSQEREMKRLKKNLRLMNLELSTLRNLKKEKIIGETQIRINRSDCFFNRSSRFSNSHLNNAETENQQNNLMMETQYFNLTNAANPNEKSYIIKKVSNQQEALHDSRRSANKPSLYGKIFSKRDSLQKKFNVSSRIRAKILGDKNVGQQTLKNYTNKENSNFQLIQQRIIQKLQNTAHFSSIHPQQQNNQFTTTITQLRQKVQELKEALIVLEEEKQFLENQLQTFEEEKFCLSSDLNAREIQIYELYKSIIALREEVRDLKYQNESYLRLIEEHQLNMHQIARKAEQSYHNDSKLRSNPRQEQKCKNMQKMPSMSVSKIDFNNEQQNHLVLEENSYESMMRQQREQVRYPLLEKIEKYEKVIEDSLLNEKEKMVLQEEIQSKEETLIDQNQKLYLQQTVIKELNSKVSYLETQLFKLNQMLNNNQKELPNIQNKDYDQNLQLLHYENEALVRQNMNLKQQTQYLSNQMDRINTEFTKLNSLLYQRQDEIAHLKLQFNHSQQQYFNKQQEYQGIITYLQNSLREMAQKLNRHNLISHPSPNLLSFLETRISDLNLEFQNLKTHIINLSQQNQSGQLHSLYNQDHSQRKEFINALLDSMQNKILTALNVLIEVNSQSVNLQHDPHAQKMHQLK